MMRRSSEGKLAAAEFVSAYETGWEKFLSKERACTEALKRKEDELDGREGDEDVSRLARLNLADMLQKLNGEYLIFSFRSSYCGSVHNLTCLSCLCCRRLARRVA